MTDRYNYLDIAKMIDHALLMPEQTDAELDEGCLMARDYDVAAVCIKPYALRRCSEILKGSSVLPCTVIGFPHGGHTTAIKLKEATQAFVDGAVEIDMVVNIGKVRSEDWGYVSDEIREVANLTETAGRVLKVIFENALIDDEEKVRLCGICAEYGVGFVKTSTGFASGGATVGDVRLMRENSPREVGVKASGGVRTLDDLLALREVGATRIGMSRSFTVLDEVKRRLGL